MFIHTLKEVREVTPAHSTYGRGILQHPTLDPKPAFCWMVENEPAGYPDRSYEGCTESGAVASP